MSSVVPKSESRIKQVFTPQGDLKVKKKTLRDNGSRKGYSSAQGFNLTSKRKKPVMSLMDFDDEILLQKQGLNTAKARHNKALSSKGIKILR